MRSFSSYGPVDWNLHYYVPRQELVDFAYQQLLGKDPNQNGHYITVWAPRQSGKTWIMREVYLRLNQDERFDAVILPLQSLYNLEDVNEAAHLLGEDIADSLGLNVSVNSLEDFRHLFKRGTLRKPLMLILDEFDGLSEPVLAGLVTLFRDIYHRRHNQANKSSAEKDYLLHGLALIGVRSVLGIENAKGSPFNVQRSMHIPNFTDAEVKALFDWYQQESGQAIAAGVIERIWAEFQGQPGLTCWFGKPKSTTVTSRSHLRLPASTDLRWGQSPVIDVAIFWNDGAFERETAESACPGRGRAR